MVATGSHISHLAQASVIEALAHMAVLKNVPLSPAELDEAAGVLFTQMDWTQVQELTGLDGLAARRWAVNAHLDMIAVARLMGVIRDIEGKDDINDPVVAAVTQEIVVRLDADLASRECVHWPNLAALAMSHYAGKPRGPTVGVREDGTVCTRWWLGVDFHRDPNEGPANIEEKGTRRVQEYWVKGQLHRPPADGPAFILTDDRSDEEGARRIEEYWVEGQLHRPHQDGPAMIYTHYRKFDVSGEEYFEHGKWHRPSELGPYPPHGTHSPALIKRDNETGVLVVEEYWRNGRQYRASGPAIIERSPEGVVIYEAFWRGERHRDASEGPSMLRYDAQGRLLAEAWFDADGRHRDASEGPGYVCHEADTGRVREHFYVDGEYRSASGGPALVTRDREGNILWEEFWDGARMRAKDSETIAVEAHHV